MKFIVLSAVCLLAVVCFTEGIVPGGKCVTNGDCTANAFCNKLKDCANGLCQCKKNYKNTDSSCKKTVLLGDTCSLVTDCYVFPHKVACTNSKCACSDAAYEPHSSKFVCIKKSLSAIGGSCELAVDCSAFLDAIDVDELIKESGVWCKNSVCGCEDGYNVDGNSCKPMKNGDSCTGSHCAYTPCRASVCQCDTTDKYVEYYVGNGVTERICTHKDAITGLGKLASCLPSPLSTGKFCSTDFACRTCPDTPTKYQCIRENLCSPSTCANGGTCSSSWGSYTCDCATPFFGKNCQSGASSLVAGYVTSLIFLVFAAIRH